MKQLYAGSLYWPTTFQAAAYDSLSKDVTTEVAIIGGGMSGVICGSVLAQNGIDVVLIERQQVAGGSTSANTGLLQFCSDVMLSDLAKQIGHDDAILFYKQCVLAVEHLVQLAASLPNGGGLERKNSLYYASNDQDYQKLQEEFHLLQKSGFAVEWWDEARIKAHYGFSKTGAIMTKADAQVNPWIFVNELARAAVQNGLQIFENTDVEEVVSADGKKYAIRTDKGHTVYAKYVVYAIGYEPEELRGQLIASDLNRSFVIVTNPQPPSAMWYEQTLLWETARPYLYLRATADNRIIIGGLDEDPAEPLIKPEDIARRSQQLLDKLHELFPHLNATIDYEWNATFGESLDDLPFIGEDPKHAGIFYCLGYGGNGTVYSMIGAELITQAIKDEQHPLTDILALDRNSLKQAPSN